MRKLEKRVWALENPPNFLKGQIVFVLHFFVRHESSEESTPCNICMIDRSYIDKHGRRYQVIHFMDNELIETNVPERLVKSTPPGEIMNHAEFEEFKKKINEFKSSYSSYKGNQ